MNRSPPHSVRGEASIILSDGVREDVSASNCGLAGDPALTLEFASKWLDLRRRGLARTERAAENLPVRNIGQSTNAARVISASWLQGNVLFTLAFEQNRTVFVSP